MPHIRDAALAAALLASPAAQAQQNAPAQPDPLGAAAIEAQKALRQTFTNLQFEDFGPAPVEGPLYQASAGGRIIYFAPKTGHLLFAAVYDRNGVNVTALAQDARARKRIASVDPDQALTIGPQGAPVVIEFTDPDCPYCQALDRFWAAKAAEGKVVRRLIYFVSGIHPGAAPKAEHILCSSDPASAFKAVYSGMVPPILRRCAAGAAKVAADAATVAKMGVSGTPTLFLGGKMVSGFQQAEIENYLADQSAPRAARLPGIPPSGEIP